MNNRHMLFDAFPKLAHFPREIPFRILDCFQRYPPRINAVRRFPQRQALELAAPAMSPARIARELFQGRVTRSGLHHWRAGRAEAPEWALAILRAELARQAETRQRLAQALRPGDGRERKIAALNRWRAKRAKEKAGIDADPSDDWKRTRDLSG